MHSRGTFVAVFYRQRRGAGLFRYRRSDAALPRSAPIHTRA